jgi:predicted metallopeptidase
MSLTGDGRWVFRPYGISSVIIFIFPYSAIIFIKNLSTVFYRSPIEDRIAVITGFICA